MGVQDDGRSAPLPPWKNVNELPSKEKKDITKKMRSRSLTILTSLPRLPILLAQDPGSALGVPPKNFRTNKRTVHPLWTPNFSDSRQTKYEYKKNTVARRPYEIVMGGEDSKPVQLVGIQKRCQNNIPR